MLDVQLKIFCCIYSSLYVYIWNLSEFILKQMTSPTFTEGIQVLSLLTIVNWACLLQHLFPLQISQDTCFTYLLPSTWTVIYFIIILGVAPPPPGRFFFFSSVLRVVKAAIHSDIKRLKMPSTRRGFSSSLPGLKVHILTGTANFHIIFT